MHIILAVTATAQISQKSRIVQSALSKGQARASASLKRDHLGNMSLASFHYEVFGKVLYEQDHLHAVAQHFLLPIYRC